MKMLLVKIGNQPGKVGERLRIYGEWSIFVLIVDVEVDDVGRNFIGAKAISNPTQLRLRSVAVTRLLESERPQRRQRRCSGEVGIAFDDLFGRWPVEKVVVEWAAFG